MAIGSLAGTLAIEVGSPVLVGKAVGTRGLTTSRGAGSYLVTVGVIVVSSTPLLTTGSVSAL